MADRGMKPLRFHQKKSRSSGIVLWPSRRYSRADSSDPSGWSAFCCKLGDLAAQNETDDADDKPGQEWNAPVPSVERLGRHRDDHSSNPPSGLLAVHHTS